MAGKPKTLTDAQRAEVETLAAVLNAEQIADYFGIGRTTFYRMMEREPDIAERYKRGKARAIGAIAQSLIQKARGGDTACMIFYLKTQAGWRETARLEHSKVEDDASEPVSAAAMLEKLLSKYEAKTIDGEARETAQPARLAGTRP